MAIKGVLHSIVKNGKRAAANGAEAVVKNGSNGNGAAKNGAEKALTAGNLAKKQFVDNHPNVKKVRRQNYGTRGPGSNVRGYRATQRRGAMSKISSATKAMDEAYPEEIAQIDSWMRGAYKYARKNGNLKGYENYIGPDGRKWRPKPNQSYGEGFSLKADDLSKRKVITDRRAGREKPFRRNSSQRDEIYRALSKVGKGDKLDKLLAIMKRDYDAKMATIPKGSTKGHLISLANGGLDVAENFERQAGKSQMKVVNGKRLKIRNNYSQKADSTGMFADGRGIDNWDDYVRLKLSQL